MGRLLKRRNSSIGRLQLDFHGVNIQRLRTRRHDNTSCLLASFSIAASSHALTRSENPKTLTVYVSQPTEQCLFADWTMGSRKLCLESVEGLATETGPIIVKSIFYTTFF